VTSFVRRVAGGLAIVESLWFLYAYYDMPPIPSIGRVPFIPIYSVASLGLAVALLAIGLMGVWGAAFSYLLGTVLSTVALLVAGFTVVIANGNAYPSAVSDDAIIGVAFALVALLANIQAIRSRGGISEQANPMNLPVFG
jgi:hypothetical protein